MLALLIHDHAQAAADRPCLLRVIPETGRGQPQARPFQAGVGEPVDDAAYQRQAVAAYLQHLCQRRARVDVYAERRHIRGQDSGVRKAERVVGRRLVEDRAAGPLVGGHDEMAQRLDEGPLVVDPLAESGFWQLPGAGDGLGPEALDRVPHRAVVLGCPHRSQLHAFGVPPVELPLHERRDIDVVDDETADKPGHPDVGEPRISDLDLAQVTVPEVRTREVRTREASTAKRVGTVVVCCHRAIVPNRPEAYNCRRSATVHNKKAGPLTGRLS